MEQNLIQASISSEDIAAVNEAIDTIRTKLKFLVSLTKEEKESLFKVGNIYKPFLDKAVQVVKLYPQIMPSTFNAQQFIEDYELGKALDQIYSKLLPLFTALDDSRTAALSDALTSSLDLYSEVKSHKDKIPGMEAISDEMKVYFPRKRAASSKTPAPVTA